MRKARDTMYVKKDGVRDIIIMYDISCNIYILTDSFDKHVIRGGYKCLDDAVKDADKYQYRYSVSYWIRG